MLKDAALALSLANLCFIQTWLSLLDYTKNFPSYYQYVAALLSVGLLALLFWVAVRLARRSRSATAWQAARLAFPLALLIPLEGILLLLLSGHRRVIELTLVIVAVALILLSDSQRWSRVIVRGAATITLMLFPFVLITFTQSAWAISSFSEGHTAFPPGDSNSSGNRVVWMIFDEMDYQIAFSTRPATLDLPEFDRLRRESIFATNAYPPADETSLSMPALITGKKISRIAQVNPSQILITYTGSDKAVNWNGEPSIFSRANEAGFSTALAGWYLPYCGVLGSSLNDCGVRNTSGGSLRRSMIKQVLVLIDTMPFGSILARRFGMLQYITQHTTLSMYRDIVANAQNMAVNPDFGIVLIHLPVPHPPVIYDRHKDEFHLGAGKSYLDNLRLADRALGQLRRAMEDAGIWESSTILVSSDHAWKTQYWRQLYSWTIEDEEIARSQTERKVPFILKLAGHDHHTEYNSEFNTVLTQDLLLDLLKGELSNPENVVDWLEQHRLIH